MVCLQKYLLAFVGYLAEDVKEFVEIVKIEVVLCCTQTDEINEVFLVIKGHVQLILAENIHEDEVRYDVVPPILHLSLALKSDSIELLGIDVVSLE